MVLDRSSSSIFGLPGLSFSEVKQLVEATSSFLSLEFDGDAVSSSVGEGQKGRFLVARKPLKAGDVLLSERPIFHGGIDALKSTKVYLQSFLEKLEEGSEVDEEDFKDDCLHPRSPLVDAIADVIQTREWSCDAKLEEVQRNKATLRLRQLGSLWRAAVSEPVPEGVAQDILKILRLDLKELVTEEELQKILHIFGSNRFGSAGEQLDLMFAGSMFEHSCAPNCFVGTWHTSSASSADQPRTYRALRDIAEGEALSIDYLLLPDGYLPASGRAEILSRWGFACTCPRCTSLPELERSFFCESCRSPELCPRGPGGAENKMLTCRSCGKDAEASYAGRCFAREAFLKSCASGGSNEATAAESNEDEEGNNLLSQFHYIVFHALWTDVIQDDTLQLEDLEAATVSLEALIQGVARLYGSEKHPLLLELNHLGAELTQDDVEAQKNFLEREHAVLLEFYPEEASRQDAEIMSMVQRNRPANAPDDFDEMRVPERTGEDSAQQNLSLGEMD
eukprot:TRINITY_DN13598_c0_g1_i1.p1 TRINITY_DN13598_c0_g1~~TRINITY_DN13598_c0_g1_i1.p1  ORF type:complete len:507 (-),score=90.39 TRINITY_DN13598_c0_g1_i1:135-1655(-)